jgi:hypothetical protein
MELSEKYKIELSNLRSAVTSFEKALGATFAHLDSIGEDLIKMVKFKNLNTALN